VKCNIITSNDKGMEYDIYQVCPRWCLIVEFLIFFCTCTFSKLFHSIGVCKSPHSSSKNSWTHAYDICAHSMESLFAPPYHSPFFHTNPHLRMATLRSFGPLYFEIWEFIPWLWLSTICPTRKEPMWKSINMDKHALPPHVGKL
jgi:hypothetical protein